MDPFIAHLQAPARRGTGPGGYTKAAAVQWLLLVCAPASGHCAAAVPSPSAVASAFSSAVASATCVASAPSSAFPPAVASMASSLASSSSLLVPALALLLLTIACGAAWPTAASGKRARGITRAPALRLVTAAAFIPGAAASPAGFFAPSASSWLGWGVLPIAAIAASVLRRPSSTKEACASTADSVSNPPSPPEMTPASRKKRSKRQRDIGLLVLGVLVLGVLVASSNRGLGHGPFGSVVLKSGPPVKASMCQALVASPYNLQPGGGEKYLLEAASVLQGIPCAVTIGLFSREQCRGDCIATLAAKLGVALDPAMVTVIEFPRGPAWRQVAHEETMRQSPYDFFFLLGNDLMPQVNGLGRINLYMCQFPFDWARPQGEMERARLLTYSMVLLNSEFSKGWYTRANERTGALTRPCAPIPTVLYPPVQAIAGAVVPLYQRPLRIVMLGRVFDEVQQKGHMVAIKAFARLQVAWLAAPPMQRPPLELYLVGAVMTGHELYAERVQKLGNATPGVHVLLDASRERVLSILSASRVVWSLTGFKQNRDDLERVAHRLSATGDAHAVAPSHQMCDPSAALPPNETPDMGEEEKSAKCPNPADTEHFGIAVTEAMSAGAIPVLLHMGGLAELVPSRRVGRLAADASEIVTSTLEVLLQSDEQLGAMSNASIVASRRFTGGTFHRRFKAMLHKGHLPRFWAGLTRSVCADPIDLSVTSKGRRRRPRMRLIAAIVDTRVDYTIATAVKANLRHLRAHHAQWRLRVVHGTENAQFVRDSLADVRPVEFVNLGVATMTEYDYNVLLKTPSFWRSMEADRCLIFQTDGLLLRPIPNAFLRFDWVGAPWTPDNDVYKGINEDKVAIPTLDRSVRVGNGGFSLRGVQAMERICTEHAAESQPAEQEDVFLVRNLHRHGYNIADLESAATFALEVPIPEHAVDTSRLVAIHQAWNFVRPEVLAQLLQIICSECGQVR